eukprot:33553_1
MACNKLHGEVVVQYIAVSLTAIFLLLTLPMTYQFIKNYVNSSDKTPKILFYPGLILMISTVLSLSSFCVIEFSIIMCKENELFMTKFVLWIFLFSYYFQMYFLLLLLFIRMYFA